jgi:hypothetical protein
LDQPMIRVVTLLEAAVEAKYGRNDEDEVMSLIGG